jgi:hypothetical protein
MLGKRIGSENRMEIKISIPLKAEILDSQIEIPVSKKRGEPWSRLVLGDFSCKKGVYVHNSNDKILYVGNTTRGTYGTFGERLRREFQYTSSSNSDLHQLLANQKKPIFSSFFDLDNIDIRIIMKDAGSLTPSKEAKALIFEQVLIGIFSPIGNKGKK